MKDKMNLKSVILFYVAFFLVTADYIPAQQGADHQSHVIRKIDGNKLEVHVFLPGANDSGEKRSAILLFHGGGWRWGSAEWTFKDATLFAKQGLVAIAVEYRLSEGNTTPVDAVDDACTAYRWVREHAAEFNVDPRKVAGHGVSAGGHLAAMAAIMAAREDGGNPFSCGPDALLLWSPALDVVNDGWFRRLIQDRANAADYSPADLAGKSSPPTCIVIGDKDTLTPLAGVEKFADNVRNAGGICEMNVYPGVGHLLTRNLADQEENFDPHPEFREDGKKKFIQFLQKHGFIDKKKEDGS